MPKFPPWATKKKISDRAICRLSIEKPLVKAFSLKLIPKNPGTA